MPPVVHFTLKRQRFAELIASGTPEADAYKEAFDQPEMNAELAFENAKAILKITDVMLRIQELRRPVIRKVQKKFEYNLNKALQDAEDAYNIAYEHQNAGQMLAAIELRAKLCKFLTEQVEHRYGVLDDVSTQTLLMMKQQIEQQRRGKLKLVNLQNTVLVEPESVA